MHSTARRCGYPSVSIRAAPKPARGAAGELSLANAVFRRRRLTTSPPPPGPAASVAGFGATRPERGPGGLGIPKFNKNRSDDNDTWIKVLITCINLFYRKIITRAKLYEISRMFSSKSDKYDECKIDEIIDDYIKRYTTGKGYGIKYLLECLKIDDEEYYKKMTEKDMVIDNANDIGACEIDINYY